MAALIIRRENAKIINNVYSREKECQKAKPKEKSVANLLHM